MRQRLPLRQPLRVMSLAVQPEQRHRSDQHVREKFTQRVVAQGVTKRRVDHILVYRPRACPAEDKGKDQHTRIAKQKQSFDGETTAGK